MNPCKSALCKLISIVLLSFAFSSPSYAFDEKAELRNLFDHPVYLQVNYSPHTFVFLIHGAADHYVPESLDNLTKDTHWGNADAADVAQIRKLSTQCTSCNVVLLHIQRGGSHWYTRNLPWATYLRVYSGNMEVFSHHVKRINAADPDVVTNLITFAKYWFRGSMIHFIYRGHSFFPGYDPKQKTLPFDYNFPENPYSLDVLMQSLNNAHLTEPLASITLAACSMGFPEVTNPLKQFAHSVIAFPEDVEETLSRGFSYRFLSLINQNSSEQDVANAISSTVFERVQ